MVVLSVAEFEKDFDAYMDRIEANKEKFLVRKSDGTAVVAMPVEELEQATEAIGEDDWYNVYSNHDDAS